MIQTEAECQVLINMILLCVASTMSNGQTDINVILEYPIATTTFSNNHSFGGVINFLVAKLPACYTCYTCKYNICPLLGILNHFYLLAFLLGDPANTLANPDGIKGPITSNIFEVKWDNVQAAIGQAVIVAASHCKQHGCFPQPILCHSCLTSHLGYL